MKTRFGLSLIAVAAMLAFTAPAFAGHKNDGGNTNKHDPVAKEADHLQKGIDQANKAIDKNDAKLAKLALQDQTSQKVIDKTAQLNDSNAFFSGVAAAFQAALDALTPSAP